MGPASYAVLYRVGHKYTNLRVIFARMKNITITLDPETAALGSQCKAAEKNMSVSRLVGEIAAANR